MTTKRHEEERRQEAEAAAKKQEAEAKKHREEAQRHEEVKPGQPTADPMATPPWPVHGPNPPSEPKE